MNWYVHWFPVCNYCGTVCKEAQATDRAMAAHNARINGWQTIETEWMFNTGPVNWIFFCPDHIREDDEE